MRSVLLWFLSAFLVPAIGLSSTDVDSKLSPGLVAQLEMEEERVVSRADRQVYRVVVDLLSDTIQDDSDLARALATPERQRALRREIAEIQDRVIHSLQFKGGNLQTFKVWNRYQSTLGFSAYADSVAIRTLAAHAEVAFVHEMPVYSTMDAQAHSLTRTEDVHIDGTTGSGVTIAIIDDGIDADHAAFGGSTAWPNGKILGGWDFADNDNDPRTDCVNQSHGTAVAGVAAGDGGGVVGSAPDAQLVFLKVQSASICGTGGLDGDVPAAIDWVVTHRNNFTPPIRILSMSLGTCATHTNPCPDIAERNALAAARNAGIVTLVASGNSAASNGISSPACHPDAVSVGAVYDSNVGARGFSICNLSTCNDASTFADRVTCYSNSDTFLDLLAPSDCATTAASGGGNNFCFNGTSSATPYAAGVAALLLEEEPTASRNTLISALKNGSPTTDPRNGISVPRVDAEDAIAALDPCTLAPPVRLLMTGPTSRSPGQSGVWSANAWSGTPPYRYSWFKSAAGSGITDLGDGSTATTADIESFKVVVDVTDACGRFATDYTFVDVNGGPGFPPLPH